MEKEPTLNDIYLAVGELNGEVKGINSRLDRMNGNIENHDKRINKNESSIDRQKGKTTAYSIASAFIFSAIGAIVAYFRLKK